MRLAVPLLAVPIMLLAALSPSSAETAEQFLNQSPEKLAQLRNDPHVAKAMKFLEVSDSRAAILQQADDVVERVVLSEEHEHPGQNALFWNGFRERVRSQITQETNDFMVLSAQLYAQRFTDAELDQLINFYSSGIGAKYFRERQVLDREEVELASIWSRDLAPKVLEKVRSQIGTAKGGEP